MENNKEEREHKRECERGGGRDKEKKRVSPVSPACVRAVSHLNGGCIELPVIVLVREKDIDPVEPSVYYPQGQHTAA